MKNDKMICSYCEEEIIVDVYVENPGTNDKWHVKCYNEVHRNLWR